jgi:hypothetical protein
MLASHFCVAGTCSHDSSLKFATLAIGDLLDAAKYRGKFRRLAICRTHPIIDTLFVESETPGAGSSSLVC